MPPPYHPKQYRALGVMEAQYTPIDKFTRGIMVTRSQQQFNTVVLPRAIASVKNHVDFNSIHRWLVYPHGVKDSNQLHLQIMGVIPPSQMVEGASSVDYFSIRGEVLYSNRKTQKVIVKIRQKKKGKKSNFFKLELQGAIPSHSVHHFYNFDVILEGINFVIYKSIDMGFIAVNY
ncbi:MAG: 2-dehydropantoate 2-reductase [Cyanobacterium sp. T60_A2020_053]|nr:2-dehydropantoate 2-reductase [Cyanobacterium sp. T60_A2020_053]